MSAEGNPYKITDQTVEDLINGSLYTPYPIGSGKSSLYNTDASTGRGKLIGPYITAENSSNIVKKDPDPDPGLGLSAMFSKMYGKAGGIDPKTGKMVGATGIGGFAGIMDAINTGTSVVNSIGQYRTNAVNRKLGEQQLAFNQDMMDKIKRSDEGLSNAFGHPAATTKVV